MREPALESASKKQKALGFQSPDFSWDDYIRYRPMYPLSLYDRIYTHHSQARPSNSFTTALDVGSGPGIVAELLASKFQHVVVAEPNAEHLSVARQRLGPHFPAGKFTFLAETGEQSSLQDRSVDCITAAVSLHWCEVPLAVAEFSRILKSGGTLCVVHYSTPRLVGNDKANKAWKALCMDLTDGYWQKAGPMYQRLMKNLISGHDNLPLTSEIWEDGAQRHYTNCGGAKQVMEPLTRMQIESSPTGIRASDEMHFIEDDTDWIVEEADLEWLQGQFLSYTPGRTLADDKERWVQIEEALGGREKKVKVYIPSLQILATRK